MKYLNRAATIVQDDVYVLTLRAHAKVGCQDYEGALVDANKVSLLYTAKLKPIWTVGSGFSSISPSNLGQIPKSRTVLKSARSQLSKTVPDFEI